LQHRAALGEERGVSLASKVLEGTDTDDPVDGFVELFPALQADIDNAVGRQIGDDPAGVVVLISAQGQADDV